ncbi:GGDEF domain-containing protein [Paraburkholderia silviterrae]|uniref:diguanylate cyclase n=1 Tax=Paraburkholderia silviterrae TaxID=2528715 RepID=A0A4R5MGF8_9BURK|nr:GGDEF domain-containing protein [Paraburkholderia silviterrae]TDG26157.1 diguanylate cyclase [Paraburkholderia silviterrae]
MLDPVNILLVTVLSSIMSLAILGSLRPAGIPGVSRWMGAYVMASGALVLAGMQRMGVPLLTIFVSNTLLACAITRVLEGCREFFGLSPRAPLARAGCAAVGAGIAWWYWITPDLAARIALVSVFHGSVYSAIGWLALRHRPAGRPAYSYRFVTCAAWLGAFAHGLRGIIYGTGLIHQSTMLDFTPFNVAYLALGILVLPALSIGMVLLAHDRMAERLEHLASRDELTGALTRRAFLTQATAALDAARAAGTPHALAIVDIDHFKGINDRYGHAAGDRALSQFGRVIAAGMRESDLFGRLGGEEFALLFPAMVREDAVMRLDALRVAALAVRRGGCATAHEASPSGSAQDDGEGAGDDAPAAHAGLTFSAGVDVYQDGDTLASLMARADAALYEAKTRGRDRVVSATAQ